MQFLKRAAFAGLALLTLAGASPVAAQFFPPDGPPLYPRDPGYDPDGYQQPDWRHRQIRRHRPRYEDPYEQPRGPVGFTCWTRRGTCDLDDGRPVNTVCKCYIPGFGPKRGYVQP
jgi:hypothetical protein